MFAHSYS